MPKNLLLYQSLDYLTKNSQSPTSVLSRLVFQEESRGVLTLFQFQKQQIIIASISKDYYDKMLSLKNQCQNQLGDIKINVIRVQKDPTTGKIPGLDILANEIVEEKYCGIFTQESNDMNQAKVMKVIFDLKEQGVEFTDCNQYYNRIIEEMYKFNQHFVRNCIDSAKQAMQELVKVDSAIANRSKNININSISRFLDVEFAKDTLINQNNEMQAYASHQKLAEGKWISITNTNEPIKFIKSIQLTYDGHWYSLQQNTQQNPVEAIKITAIKNSVGSIGLFSRTTVLCSRQDQIIVDQACNELKQIHQKRLDLALNSQTYGQLNKQAREVCGNVMKQEYSLDLTPFIELDQPSIGGSVVHGSIMMNHIQDNEKPLLIRSMNESDEIPQNMIINVRTTAKITFEKLECSIIVTMSDVVNHKNGIITTPEFTKVSPSVILRDYYTIQTTKQNQVELQAIQQRQQAQQESDSESYSEEEEQPKLTKDEQYKIKQRLYEENQKKLDELQKKLEENMQMRKDQLELICDQNQESYIQHAYDSIDSLPETLDFTEYMIIEGDNTNFFQTCGIPIPFLPQYIQNCTITETAPYLLKIKFIAPGQISGKKEMHKQIQYYAQTKTFLKELCFETNNPNVAKRVRDKILAYKKLGDESVAKEVLKNRIIRNVDPWGDLQNDQAIQKFVQSGNEQIDYNGVTTIDSNQMTDLIQMRPKYKLKGQATSKQDFTSLKATKNCLIYRYSFSQQKIEVVMPYKDIRNIYYDKFTDKNHVSTLVIEFFQPKTIQKLIPNKETQRNLAQADNALQQQSTYFFTLYISKETEAKLGYTADREDYNQEKKVRLQMKDGNKVMKKFLQEVKTLAPLINITSQNHQLIFQGSIENSGLSQIASYSPAIVGLFNKKTSECVNLCDIQFVLFENVNYSSQTSIIASFVYKDVRVSPWQVKQINFDYMQTIQQYLIGQNIPYYEYNNSFNWKQFIENLNQSRENFKGFVEDGGWNSLFGDQEDSSQQSEQASSDYTDDGNQYSEGSYDDSYDSDSEDVQSETENNESEDTGDVYDWSQEDSD